MNVMGIIFTNDATMGELTNKRTMASIPFGGRYRRSTGPSATCPAPVSVTLASSPVTPTSL